MEKNETYKLYDEVYGNFVDKFIEPISESVQAYIENDIEVTEELYKDMSRAKRRKNNFRKAKHKAYLDKHVSWCPMYNNLHQYSKNKIHCSCPWCSPKTKRRSKSKSWGPGRYNYKISDQRKVDRMEDEMKGE